MLREDETFNLSFYRSQNVLGWSKFFVPDQKFIYILWQSQTLNILFRTKRWFAFNKIVFCASTKLFEEALKAIKFLDWLKKFWPTQNILGPVEGQDIFRSYCSNIYCALTILSLPPHKAITSLFDKFLWLLLKQVFLSKLLVAHRMKLVLNFHISITKSWYC